MKTSVLSYGPERRHSMWVKKSKNKGRITRYLGSIYSGADG